MRFTKSLLCTAILALAVGVGFAGGVNTDITVSLSPDQLTRIVTALTATNVDRPTTGNPAVPVSDAAYVKSAMTSYINSLTVRYETEKARKDAEAQAEAVSPLGVQ